MWNKQLWYLNFILTSKNLKIFICSLIGFSILNLISLSFYSEFSRGDYFVYSLFGYGIGYFDLISLLGLILINGLPLYLIAAMVTEDTFNNSMFLIRFQKIRIVFNNMQIVYLIYFAVYLLIHLLIVIMIGSLFSSQGTHYIQMLGVFNERASLTFTDINPITLILFASLLRLMELMIIQIIFISFYTILKYTIGSFLITMGFYMLLIFNLNSYYPIGISSIYRLLTLDEDFLVACVKAIGILSLTYLIGYIYIYVKGYKKLYS